MLNYLESFIRLSENLSFSKTATEMNVSQPSISRQITLLEESLGVQLFLRNKHRVSLTQQGKDLKNKIEPLYKDLIATLKSPKETQVVSGTIRFGCLVSIGQWFFMKHILDFSKKYPEVQFNIEYMKSTEVIEAIRSSKIDFGVSFLSIEGENFRSYELLKEENVILTRSGHNKLPKDYKNPPFVAYRPEAPLLFSFLKKLKIKDISIPITVNSHISMIDVLLSRDIFGIVPMHAVKKYLDDRKLKVISPMSLEQKIYLIHPDNPHMETKGKLFKNHLFSVCKGEKA